MAQFDDGKEQGALRTIGEVADALGIRQHVLRYWEQQFPMLQPLKRSGGRRYYRPHDVALVEAINRLVNQEGYTLKGAKKALSQKDSVQTDMSQKDMMTPTDPVEAPGTATAETPAPTLPGFSFDADLPVDGGVEAFFGAGAAAQGEPDSAAQPADEPVAEAAAPAAPPPSGQAELVEALKSIRDRLAAALAA